MRVKRTYTKVSKFLTIKLCEMNKDKNTQWSNKHKEKNKNNIGFKNITF